MHELSIATDILEAVISNSRSMKKIQQIHVSVGCLCCLNIEQLEFCFKTIAKGTPAEDAEINFHITQAKFQCNAGHETTAMVSNHDFHHLLPLVQCSICGKPAQIIEGKEIYLTKLIGE